MTLLLALACLPLFADEPPAQASSKAGQVKRPRLTSSRPLETVIQDAIARAEPSVVAIHREKGENPEETLAVRGRQHPGPTSGSAVCPRAFPSMPTWPIPSRSTSDRAWSWATRVRSSRPYHVVKGAVRLEVRAADRQQFDAEIIAADPRSDLAVIVPVVDPDVPAPQLKPIALGDSTLLRKGSFLIALGNPFNAAQDGKPSASWGILSNVARRVEPDLDGIGNALPTTQLPQLPHPASA